MTEHVKCDYAVGLMPVYFRLKS